MSVETTIHGSNRTLRCLSTDAKPDRALVLVLLETHSIGATHG